MRASANWLNRNGADLNPHGRQVFPLPLHAKEIPPISRRHRNHSEGCSGVYLLSHWLETAEVISPYHPPPPPTLICRDDFNPLATFTSIPSLPNPHCPSTLRFLSIHLYLLHLSPKHSTLHSFLISLTKSVPGISMMEQGQVPVKSGDTCSTLYGV